MKLTAAVSNLNYPCTDNIVHYRILRACAYNEQLKMKCNSQVSLKKRHKHRSIFLVEKKKEIFFNISRLFSVFVMVQSLQFGCVWMMMMQSNNEPTPTPTKCIANKFVEN